jgi:fumarate hydratase class II
MNVNKTLIETDRFGLIEVPAKHYWGAQTQRSLGRFAIGSQTIPFATNRALAIVKRTTAEVNRETSDFCWPTRSLKIRDPAYASLENAFAQFCSQPK